MKAAGLSHLEEDLIAHFCVKMAPAIKTLQGDSGQMDSIQNTVDKQCVSSLNEAAEEVLNCSRGLELNQVISRLKLVALYNVHVYS